MIETHRFRNDTQTRKRLMVPESFAHPAKGHLGLWQTMIERYSHDGQYVDLPGQTEALLLEVGWVKQDYWRRELWSLSFWRILQKRRDPAAFDERLKFEEVLAFRKGAA